MLVDDAQEVTGAERANVLAQAAPDHSGLIGPGKREVLSCRRRVWHARDWEPEIGFGEVPGAYHDATLCPQDYELISGPSARAPRGEQDIIWY